MCSEFRQAILVPRSYNAVEGDVMENERQKTFTPMSEGTLSAVYVCTILAEECTAVDTSIS